MADEELNDQQADQVDEVIEAEDDQEQEKEKSLEDKLKEVVEVDVEDVGGLRKKLTITIPRDALDEQLDEQYGELRREAMVPGFRKGRAPRRLLEKRFGNEVSETLVQQLIGTGYTTATEKADLKVIGDPLIWIKAEGAEGETLVDVNKAVETIEFPDEGPLEFSCEVEIQPEFELPELEGIPIEKPVLNVGQKEVDEYVERICAMRGKLEVVSDSKVEPDDVLTTDLTISSEGAQIKQEEGVKLSARGQVVEGVKLDKLGEELAGAKADEVKTVSGEFPEDYAQADLRGKKVDIEIKIREIHRFKAPELNDELIKSLGFESEKDLREFAKNDLESRLGEQVRQAIQGQVYQYLHDKTEFELPERLSERQTDRVVARRMLELYRQGVPPAEVEKYVDEMKMGAREEALRDLKLAFIMEALSEKFEVKVIESEINGVIASIAQRQGQRFDRVRDELIKQDGISNIYIQLRDEKIVEQLLAKAKTTEKEPEKEPTKKPEKEPAKKPEKKSEKKPAKKQKAKKTKASEEESPKSRPKRTPPTKTKAKKGD